MIFLRLLLDLPSSLVDEIIGGFLDLKDVNRLDSAVCSSCDRPDILKILYDTTLLRLPLAWRSSGDMSLFRICEATIDWLISRNVKLAELKITNLKKISGNKWRNYLTVHGRHIIDVHFSPNRLETGVYMMIKDLCKYCPNVSSLICSVDFSPADYNHISKAWSQSLKKIWIPRMPMVTMKLIGSKCQRLEEMEVVLHGIQTNEDSLLALLEVSSTSLTKLKLSATQCSNPLLYSISARFPLLVELNFSESTSRCTDEGLMALSRGCPLLNSICLQSNPLITDMGLSAIARNGNLTSLRLCDLNNVTDKSMKVVEDFNHSLRNVALTMCRNISISTLTILGEHSHSIRHLYFSNMQNISDTVLCTFSRNNPFLDSFTFGACREISDAGMSEFAHNCAHLEKLSLNALSCVTDVSILALAQHCTRLKSFSVSFSSIRDVGLQLLVKNCRQLHFLSLFGCLNVTDYTLVAIATHCAQLSSLNVIGAELITLKGLRYLAENCRSCLTEISVAAGVGSRAEVEALFGPKVQVILR